VASSAAEAVSEPESHVVDTQTQSQEVSAETTESETEAIVEPLSEDGEALTRTDIMPIAASRLMGKSTCVDFAQYTSSRWYCNRYHTTGSHSSGHYFYATSIAYHTVDGELTYCIEPNVTSLSGQYYSGYQANSAASSSYWMLELDSTQRSYIQQILAFGYPSIDRGLFQAGAVCRYADADLGGGVQGPLRQRHPIQFRLRPVQQNLRCSQFGLPEMLQWNFGIHLCVQW
jgi:hypothetical protein